MIRIIGVSVLAMGLSTTAGAYAEVLPKNLQLAGETISITGEFAVPADEGMKFEKVMGDANFVKVSSLPSSNRDYQLSRKVGQLLMVNEDSKIIGGCTGSLVGPSLFLTNHHCLNEGQLEGYTYIVAMEHMQEGKYQVSEGKAAGAVGVLQKNESLDFALLYLSSPLGETYGWIELENDVNAILSEDEVKIIQHPDMRSKEIVTEDTQVVKSNRHFLHYLADTEGGSSGSPVFALGGEKLIALHHAGKEGQYNEGVLASSIFPFLELYLPGGAAANANATAARQNTNTTASPPPPPPPPEEDEDDGHFSITGE
ncbi:MAG: serine protease [Pseudomonadota bacterium]